MVIVRRPRISQIGFSCPEGFQMAPGMIGSTATLNTSNAMCNLACIRGANRRTEKSA
jgi:hypothetical protein